MEYYKIYCYLTEVFFVFFVGGRGTFYVERTFLGGH